MPDVQNANLSKIIKRLELIKSPISLEEEDGTGARTHDLVMLIEKKSLISLSK